MTLSVDELTIGLRFLARHHKTNEIYAFAVEEISPTRAYVRVRGEWYSRTDWELKMQLNVLELLPAKKGLSQ